MIKHPETPDRANRNAAMAIGAHAPAGPAQRDTPAATASQVDRRPIVHLLKHVGYGNGSVHVAVDLACVQAQAGHQVIVASSGGTFVDMLTQHGVRHIEMRQDMRTPAASLASVWRLLRLCRSAKPAVLHAHMMGSAAIAYPVSRLTGTPLVTTVHNSFDKHSVIMRLGDMAVAVSAAERDHLISRGYTADRVAVVVNAPSHSPREDFMPNAAPITLARPCVTAICGLHRRKGVFDLIEAFASVAADFPDWQLAIAGEGPDSAALQQQVRDRGLAGCARFLGFVPSPQTLFAQSDIFVLASYADPGSLSIGEARAAGCAIIATAVGGTPEMLDHGRAGRLVAPGAPVELASALRELMSNPALRAELQAAARNGSQAFDVHQLVPRYATVYADAARGRRRG